MYLCTVYADIKGISKRKINTIYDSLPIKTRKDINITGNEISEILNKKPGDYIKEIMLEVEKNILNNKLDNNNEDIKKYIINNYNN